MKYLSLIFLLLWLQSSQLSAAQKTLTFGVVPQQSASKLLSIWGPLLSHLSKETGIKLVFKTAKDIPSFEKALAQGRYDIAYMNPFHYTEFHKSPGYQAFAKSANKQIKGIIVINKNSAVKTLKDLEGKTLVFPSRYAFAATLLTQALFHQEKVAFKSKYVSSHDSVYLNVAKGTFPAGGGIHRTFSSIPLNLQNQLMVLKTTAGHTPHAFAAHPKISSAIVDQLVIALVGLRNNKTGQVLLNKLKMSAIESAKNRDWDDIRALNIQTTFTE